MKFVHNFIALPFRIIFVIFQVALVIASIVQVLAWTRIQIFRDWAALINTDTLGPYVGFKGGFAPISSWTNLGLYLAATTIAPIIMLPFFILGEFSSKEEKTLGGRLRIRLATGKSIARIGFIAKATLLVALVLCLINVFAPPLHGGIRWTILAAMGIGIGISNMTFSSYGEKWGLMPGDGILRAIKFIGEEEGLEFDVLIQRLKDEKEVAAASAMFDASAEEAHGKRVVQGTAAAIPTGEITPKTTGGQTRVEDDLIYQQQGYRVLDCACGANLKAPPGLTTIKIKCPHCERKHKLSDFREADDLEE